LSVDLNEPKDSSKTNKAAQNGRTPKSLTLEIHHGGWFTPTPSSLGLDYGRHSLNVDADVLDMSKYVKDYKIMLVYVEHGSSIVDTSMFDSSPDVNKNITKDESTWKQMVVHVGTSSIADDFSFGKFKEVEVKTDTESREEESDTEGNDTSGSDSEDLDYDPNHDDVFDNDEHIVEEVHVNMNNDLDDGIDSERRIQLRELRRIGKQKNKGPNKYNFYLGQQFATLVPYVAIDTNMDKNVFSQTKPAIRENINIGKQIILAIKACTSRFLSNHVIKSLATNPDILARAVQDQMQKQFEVGVSKMKAFRAKRIASDIMIGRAKCDLLINNICKVFNRKWSELVNPCNGRDMWPVIESRTVIIPPLYKPLIDRPPKKRKKSNDEIASQSASWKGKLVSCDKCGNMGLNKKGCRGQGGGSSQTGARKVCGQAAGSRKVSSQVAGARNVSGQASGARKASSQPSVAQSLVNQGPRQGFQGPIAGPASGSQRKTKKLVDL
ncbi:hypothetical protein Tco_1115501, partial [Tanacetum coccineum]